MTNFPIKETGRKKKKKKEKKKEENKRKSVKWCCNLLYKEETVKKNTKIWFLEYLDVVFENAIDLDKNWNKSIELESIYCQFTAKLLD